MTASHPPVPPPPPPPPSNQAQSTWWKGSPHEWPTGNVVDVVLSVAWVVFVGSLAAAVVALLFNSDEVGSAQFVVNVLMFQLVLFSWPAIVSKTKGLGLAADWGFSSELPRDIARGIALAAGCYLAAGLLTVIVSSLISLPTEGNPSNDAILTDHEGTAWVAAIAILVVIGAPLVEELLYRGLIMRSLQRTAGLPFAMIASSFLFTIGHWQPDHTWRENTVLLTALFGVGAVLAFGAAKWNRLGPSIIGHLVFNGLNTWAILA